MCHKDFANVALKSSPAPPASLEAYEANPSTKFNMMLRIVQHHFGHAGAAPLALAANDDDEPENPDEPNNVRPTDIAQVRGGLWTQGRPVASPESSEPPVDTRTPSAAAGKHDKIVIFSSFASHFDYMLAVSTNLIQPSQLFADYLNNSCSNFTGSIHCTSTAHYRRRLALRRSSNSEPRTHLKFC